MSELLHTKPDTILHCVIFVQYRSLSKPNPNVSFFKKKSNPIKCTLEEKGFKWLTRYYFSIIIFSTLLAMRKENNFVVMVSYAKRHDYCVQIMVIVRERGKKRKKKSFQLMEFNKLI